MDCNSFSSACCSGLSERKSALERPLLRSNLSLYGYKLKSMLSAKVVHSFYWNSIMNCSSIFKSIVRPCKSLESVINFVPGLVTSVGYNVSFLAPFGTRLKNTSTFE
ncbi:hypothetical protein BC01_201 [Bacillus phage BC01]|nr:hypothetical protein BC01_201 [Bacillus phage BC01]